jgi:hypothetical protein
MIIHVRARCLILVLVVNILLRAVAGMPSIKAMALTNAERVPRHDLISRCWRQTSLRTDLTTR